MEFLTNLFKLEIMVVLIYILAMKIAQQIEKTTGGVGWIKLAITIYYLIVAAICFCLAVVISI